MSKAIIWVSGVVATVAAEVLALKFIDSDSSEIEKVSIKIGIAIPILIFSACVLSVSVGSTEPARPIPVQQEIPLSNLEEGENNLSPSRRRNVDSFYEISIEGRTSVPVLLEEST